MGSKNGTGKIRKAKSDIEHVDRLRDMIRDAERAEFLFSNEAKVFEGNSLEFMQATYRCERLPVRIRLYAANRAIDYEPRLREDPVIDALYDRQVVLDQMARNDAVWLAECDARLRELILDGRVSEDAAALVRDIYVDGPDAPPWEPSPQASEAPPRQIAYLVPEADAEQPQPSRTFRQVAPDEPAPQPTPWSLPDPKPPPPGFVLLHCEPHRNFWINGTGTVSANERGELLVADDEAQIATLQRAGCRLNR
jgi:hypothetical protein